MSITAVLVPDAKAAARASRLKQLIHDSSRIVTAVSVFIALFASAAIIALGLIGKVSFGAVGLGLVVVVSLTINGRTAVTTTTGIGIGLVGIDIPNLSLAAVLTVLVWVVAVFASSGTLLVIGEAIVLSVLSIAFILRSERRMIRVEKTI